MMNIRPFTDGDAAEASVLITTCLRDVTSEAYSEEAISHICAEYTPEGLIEKSRTGPMLVAEEDGRIVATARLENDTVFTVYVDPTMHRRRIGSRIMDAIEEHARKSGLRSVRVEAFVSSTGFYARRGYESVRTMSIEGFGDVVEMRKEL